MRSALETLRRWIGRGGDADAAARWIVVDTETAGLDPERDALLAIGGVAVDGSGIVLDDSFEAVLRAEAPSAAANVIVHGIGHGMQADGMPLPDALTAFERWAASAPCVGFHADFDRAVLRRASTIADRKAAAGPWLDVAPLAAALLPDAYRRGARSLDDWLAALEIHCPLRHNAAADALATAELLLRLRAVAAKQGRTGFDALVRTARQQKWLGAAG